MIFGTRFCRTISLRGRGFRAFYGGKYYSYPLSAFEALKNLGVFASASCMMSYSLRASGRNRQPALFHDWVRNQFGEKLFRIFFKTRHREGVKHVV